MCTLCLSDMGEIRDEWLREPGRLPPRPVQDEDAVRTLLAGLVRSLPVSAPASVRDAA